MASFSNLRINKNLPEEAYMLDILTRNAAHFLLILYYKLYRSYHVTCITYSSLQHMYLQPPL